MNEQLAIFLKGRVTIIVGNLVKQDVTAIVNAANSTLLGGGGVDGAIHMAGGPRILEECKEIRRARFPGGLPTGEAVMTTGGNLPAQYVIHTVGPIKGANGSSEKDAELLAACYRNSLTLAAQHDIKTIAFPAISTGIFAYPHDEAAAVSSEAIESFLHSNDSIEVVRLVFYKRDDADIFLDNHSFTKDG
jgi:O-acetyl-ADP-ribose deacetylase (regulator of RNase III)